MLNPVLWAKNFIFYVKTIRLLYRLTSGSLWCAWQSHNTDPTNQSAPEYRCSKHFAITSWSLPSIYMNQNTFVKFQVTHQQSHYVLLVAVGDKGIVMKLCWCNKHRAINQKFISMYEIQLWGKHWGSTTWLRHSFWKWTSGLEGKTVRKNMLIFFTQLSFFHWLPIVSCPTFWYQLHTSLLCLSCWLKMFLSLFTGCQHFVSLCCGD